MDTWLILAELKSIQKDIRLGNREQFLRLFQRIQRSVLESENFAVSIRESPQSLFLWIVFYLDYFDPHEDPVSLSFSFNLNSSKSSFVIKRDFLKDLDNFITEVRKKYESQCK